MNQEEAIKYAYKQGVRDVIKLRVINVFEFSFIILVALLAFKFVVVPAVDNYFDNTEYITIPCETVWDNSIPEAGESGKLRLDGKIYLD